MLSISYKLPYKGLGTDFSEYERPIVFAKTYTNRFRDITGGAARRPGISRFSSPITGSPTLTRLHEHVNQTGGETLLTSDDFGNIYRYNGSAWSTARSGGSFVRYISGQAEDKLMFVNGVDRNIYTNDGGVTFSELKAIITQGTLAAGSSATSVVDGDISDWASNTLVANNDIIYNVTQDGYGIVTVVGSALTITAIASVAVQTGAGVTSTGQNQIPGDVYQLIDYVDLNIIPRPDGTSDNVAIAGTGTTITTVAVSGINFANTEIRAGDFIYNTTRAALGIVGSVSANVNFAGTGGKQLITTQVAGDSLVFFKSAMPISSWVHVHYGRTYYLDARNNRRIVISAPDDPQDLTTYQKTLDATSYSTGTQQPTGDALLTLGTFQKYFVAAGLKNLLIFDGQTPIADSSTTDVDFKPIAFYPNGVVGRFGLGTNGSDLLHITSEGLQAINIGNISNTTVQNNASVPVRQAMLDAIAGTNTNNVQYTFYPRRSWHINKTGDIAYILNTNPTYSDAGEPQTIASWHLFTGPWAQQNHYFVRRNGDLLACGQGGLVYQMDSSAVTDDGARISTQLTMPWLTMEEPQKTLRIKQGKYIRPVFESGAGVEYTIGVIAGWDNYSSDSITVSAGGTGAIGSAIIGTTPIGGGQFAQAQKYPLTWRGEQAQITFTSESSASPDVITGFALMGNIAGIR